MNQLKNQKSPTRITKDRFDAVKLLFTQHLKIKQVAAAMGMGYSTTAIIHARKDWDDWRGYKARLAAARLTKNSKLNHTEESTREESLPTASPLTCDLSTTNERLTQIAQTLADIFAYLKKMDLLMERQDHESIEATRKGFFDRFNKNN